eukprot:1155616-Pelagomonas_calceolata.AAC.8
MSGESETDPTAGVPWCERGRLSWSAGGVSGVTGDLGGQPNGAAVSRTASCGSHSGSTGGKDLGWPGETAAG